VTRLIGADAILIALLIAVVGFALAMFGARRGRTTLIEAAYACVYTVFALVTVATLAMIYALVTHDFSVSYVAQVGSRSTPTFFTVISLWGSLEGSILFWAWVLSLYSAAVVFLNRRREGLLVPYATATLFFVSIFFLILLVGPADPFVLMSPVPPDGPGPNPLLQNHVLMAVHPPLLYLGYVGMSVPFAFAVGAMLAGELKSAEWIRITRRWTLSAWGFLSLAIVAGMWWSYEVLGWGGYWAWDPVENASFLPWLTATAFLHSVMVQERRGMLRLWNLNLIVATFLLTILGTFLTRSGVLSSVHAFSEGPIGVYFLTFIAIVLVLTVAMVAGNSQQLRGAGRLDTVVSREAVFLFNNLFLTVFTFTVLLGTLFPLVAEAVRGVKVSVGEPFFNRMTLPVCAALLFLMGVGPSLPWKRMAPAEARRRLMAPAVGALAGFVVGWLFGARNVYALLIFAFAAFAAVANVREFAEGTRARMRNLGERMPLALARLVGATRRRFGGYTAHLGVITLSVAVAASSTFRTERDATLLPGESLVVGGYEVRFNEMVGREEPQRTVIAADLTVLRDGREVGRMDPRLNYYRVQEQPVPTPSVRSRPTGDLYVNLMAFTPDGSQATIRVIVEPLVPWIWFGGAVVALGALISIFPTGRRRVAESTAERAVPSRQPAYPLSAAPTTNAADRA
jgi:cytochrome c-type biogenesis protein CcmF